VLCAVEFLGVDVALAVEVSGAPEVMVATEAGSLHAVEVARTEEVALAALPDRADEPTLRAAVELPLARECPDLETPPPPPGQPTGVEAASASQLRISSACYSQGRHHRCQMHIPRHIHTPDPAIHYCAAIIVSGLTTVNSSSLSACRRAFIVPCRTEGLSLTADENRPPRSLTRPAAGQDPHAVEHSGAREQPGSRWTSLSWSPGGAAQ
jgi:hypothetical protein